MANVLNYIFSHAQVTKKNLLVTMLIVSLFYTPCHHIIECFCYSMVYSSDFLICDYLSSDAAVSDVGVLQVLCGFFRLTLNCVL